jgi:hypothetical protein
VRHCWPPVIEPPVRGKWVLMQPWEFGSLPKDWLPMLRRVDEVWAYSRSVRDCYLEAEVPREKVHVVPLGVAPEVFRPGFEPLALQAGPEFRLLFGLPVVEAMACGLPVIVTGAGPALDYASEKTAYLIPAECQPLGETRIDGMETVGRPWMFEPGLDALVDLMKRVVSDRDGARAVGAVASAHIREHFTWAHTVEAVERRLRALVGDGTGPVLDGLRRAQPGRASDWSRGARVVADGEPAQHCEPAADRSSRGASVDVPGCVVLAPKGPDKTAQGNALGTGKTAKNEGKSPEGAQQPTGDVSPLQGSVESFAIDTLGVARGCIVTAPSGRMKYCATSKSASERGTTNGLATSHQPGVSTGSLASASGWYGKDGPRLRVEPAKASVSLTMIVKNEQENLPNCLASVAGVFDEIIVVDTGSTDRTKEIAREFGAKVFDFVWIDNFAAARNEALSRATGDYAFWLDADDVVEPPERVKLVALLAGLRKPSTGAMASAMLPAMARPLTRPTGDLSQTGRGDDHGLRHRARSSDMAMARPLTRPAGDLSPARRGDDDRSVDAIGECSSDHPSPSPLRGEGWGDEADPRPIQGASDRLARPTGDLSPAAAIF